MRFRLHKWYLDLVAADGEAAIAYAARLAWGPFRSGYGALLHAVAGTPATVRQAWRTHLPRPGATLEWEAPWLRAAGAWEAPCPGPEVTLLEGLTWRCWQPGGPARLRLPDGRELAGRGYAEELRLEIPPWRLPFRDLRWGRFVADAGGPHLAWIRWEEGLARGWCFRDGQPVPLAGAEEAAVGWAGGHLAIAPGRVLREGPLLREVVGPFASLATGRLAAAHERKQVARGRLEEGADSREGWVIHERVRL